MKELITESLLDLKSLGNDYQYSINQINWWLLKYSELYKEILRSYKSVCVKCVKLFEENLPYDCLRKPDYCNKKVEYQEFIRLYDRFDEITQLNKLDNNSQILISDCFEKRLIIF